MDNDIFISHASEDRNAVARPLAEALKVKGLRVWIDEERLTLGDQLLRVINDAFTRCRYGVVILSPSFFAKEWPQRELDGLMALESVSHKKVLPVWHQVDQNDIKRHMPLLAGKLAISTDNGIEPVAEAVYRAVTAPTRGPTMEPQEQFLHAIEATLQTEGTDRIEPQISNQLGDVIGLSPADTLLTLTRLANEGKITLENGNVRLPSPVSTPAVPSPTIHAGEGATVIAAPVTNAAIGGFIKDSAVGDGATNTTQAPATPIGDLIQLIAALQAMAPNLPDPVKPTAETVTKDAKAALATLNDDNATPADKRSILQTVNNGLQQLVRTDTQVRKLIPTAQTIAARIGEWLQSAGMS